jgi:hypothetical protein
MRGLRCMDVLLCASIEREEVLNHLDKKIKFIDK